LSEAQTFQLDAFPRRLDDLHPVPPIGFVLQDEGLGERLGEFCSTLVDHLDDLRQSCESERDSNHFTERIERNIIRSRALMEHHVLSDGSVDPTATDGHAELGITQGWSSQAIRIISAFLQDRLFRSHKRPYTLNPRGIRDENKIVTKLFYEVVDSLLHAGRFSRRMGHYGMKQIPLHGTCVLRYEMLPKIAFRLDMSGAWHEVVEEIIPRFSIWPIDKVLVTDPGLPESEDQEGVFWLRGGVTLSQLEEEEYLEPPPGANPVFSGKFRNLEVLRQRVAEGYESEPGTVGEENREGHKKVSLSPQFMLVEYEGALPMMALANLHAEVIPAVCEYFGVDVGMLPSVGDEDSFMEWTRRLSRVPLWDVAYACSLDGGASTNEGNQDWHLLRFEPARGKRPHNSLYRFTYDQDNLGFYGRSIVDLGCQLEDVADCILNAQTWTDHFNAHPPVIVNEKTIYQGTFEQVKRALETPGSALPADGRVPPEQAAYFLQLPEIREAGQRIAALKWEFEQTTGASAAAKGTDTARGTGTLGEIQINESKASLQLNDVVEACGEEIARLIRNLIDDVVDAVPKEAFVAWASGISGIPASDVMRVMAHTDLFSEELGVSHPTNSGGDPAVLVTLLLRIAMAFPQGFDDVKKLVRTLLELSGYPDAESLVESDSSMDPDDEAAQMRQGNWVDPNEGEDFVKHLQAHMAQMSDAQRSAQFAAAGGGGVDQETMNLLELLPQHIQETQTLLQVMIQMLQLREAEMGGGSGVGPTKEGKSAPSSEPQGSPQMGSDIRGQANGSVQ